MTTQEDRMEGCTDGGIKRLLEEEQRGWERKEGWIHRMGGSAALTSPEVRIHTVLESHTTTYWFSLTAKRSIANSLQAGPLSGPMPYTVAHSLACHTVTHHLLASHTTSEACPYTGVGRTTSGRRIQTTASLACLAAIKDSLLATRWRPRTKVAAGAQAEEEAKTRRPRPPSRR